MGGAGGDGHLFLSGFMGTGKSTVGPLLARRLGRPLLDLDARISEVAEASVAEIFAREGEDGFRRRERAAIDALIDGEPAVIALGGGAVVDPEVRRRVREAGTLVTLTAQIETIRARLAGDTSRPLLRQRGDAERLLRARAAAYADADLVVVTDERSPAAVTEAIVDWLAL